MLSKQIRKIANELMKVAVTVSNPKIVYDEELQGIKTSNNISIGDLVNIHGKEVVVVGFNRTGEIIYLMDIDNKGNVVGPSYTDNLSAVSLKRKGFLTIEELNITRTKSAS